MSLFMLSLFFNIESNVEQFFGDTLYYIPFHSEPHDINGRIKRTLEQNNTKRNQYAKS